MLDELFKSFSTEVQRLVKTSSKGLIPFAMGVGAASRIKKTKEKTEEHEKQLNYVRNHL